MVTTTRRSTVVLAALLSWCVSTLAWTQSFPVKATKLSVCGVALGQTKAELSKLGSKYLGKSASLQLELYTLRGKIANFGYKKGQVALVEGGRLEHAGVLVLQVGDEVSKVEKSLGEPQRKEERNSMLRFYYDSLNLRISMMREPGVQGKTKIIENGVELVDPTKISYRFWVAAEPD